MVLQVPRGELLVVVPLMEMLVPYCVNGGGLVIDRCPQVTRGSK